jgi:hypothetical protein
MDRQIVYSLAFANSILLVSFLISFYWCFLVALVILVCFSAYVMSKKKPLNLTNELATDVYCSYTWSKFRFFRLFASVNALLLVMFLNTFHGCFLLAALTSVGFAVYVFRETDKEIMKKIPWKWQMLYETAQYAHCL